MTTRIDLEHGRRALVSTLRQCIGLLACSVVAALLVGALRRAGEAFSSRAVPGAASAAAATARNGERIG
jgi:hypothetical protein